MDKIIQILKIFLCLTPFEIMKRALINFVLNPNKYKIQWTGNDGGSWLVHWLVLFYDNYIMYTKA